MSGSGAGRKELLTLIRKLRYAGFRVRMFKSRKQLDAYLSSERSQQHLRCIVAAGGDGTVADVANRHPGCPIAVFPLGTENLLARYLQFPRCGGTVAAAISDGRTRLLDTATSNGRRFLLMLSVGIDGDIVHAIHKSRTGTIRRSGYLLPVLKAFLSWKPKQIQASTCDGLQSAIGSHVIVTNIPQYGFGLRFAPESIPDDGRLNIRVYHGTTRWQISWHAIRLKCGLRIHPSEVSVFTATEILLKSTDESANPMVQSDGDPCGQLPQKINIEPSHLRMVVRF